MYCVTAYSVCRPRTSFAGNGGEAREHSGISSDQLLANVPVLVKNKESGEGVNRRGKGEPKRDHEPGTYLWGKRTFFTTFIPFDVRLMLLFYGFIGSKALVQYCEIHLSHYPIILCLLSVCVHCLTCTGS